MIFERTKTEFLDITWSKCFGVTRRLERTRSGDTTGGRKKETVREKERKRTKGAGRILSWKPCRAFLYLGITNTGDAGIPCLAAKNHL